MSAVAGRSAALSALAPGLLRPSFAGAARSELLKIRAQALTWVLVGGFAVLCGIVIGSLVSSDRARKLLARDPEAFYFQYLASVLTLFTFGSGVFLIVLSARLVSMEYGVAPSASCWPEAPAGWSFSARSSRRWLSAAFSC